MRIRTVAVALLFACICPSALHAYVLPYSPVLGGWLEKTKATQTLHVVQRTTLYDAKFPEGSVSVDEEIWIRRPFEYRRSANYPNGKFEVIVGRDRAVRSWGGKVDLLTLSDALGPLGALYVYADKGRLNGFLRQLGVDLSQTRWVLREREVGLEIGALNGARLALSKQDFLPMSADVAGKSYRFQMAPASRFSIPYPAVVEVWVGGHLAEKTEVRTVEADVAIDEHRFEIPRGQTTPGKK